MKKILFLHCGSNPFPSGRADLYFERAGMAVEFFRLKKHEYPPEVAGYSGVFITGSPNGAYDNVDWIHALHYIIKEIRRQHIPMMGVCFGSQVIASALCGRDEVFKRPYCEAGFTTLNLTEAARNDPIFGCYDGRVRMFVWHNDEVKADHKDMQILAYNDICPNHIWRFKGEPIWGVQGHPELTKTDVDEMLIEDRDAFINNGINPDEIGNKTEETDEAKAIIRNFADYCKKN